MSSKHPYFDEHSVSDKRVIRTGYKAIGQTSTLPPEPITEKIIFSYLPESAALALAASADKMALAIKKVEKFRCDADLDEYTMFLQDAFDAANEYWSLTHQPKETNERD